jgi:hypothetical protein
MADDRSLTDIIRFADPSGEISDAEIASISNSLKFSEVLDLISAYGYGETLYSDSDQDFISLVNNYLCEWCRKKNILVKKNTNNKKLNSTRLLLLYKNKH